MGIILWVLAIIGLLSLIFLVACMIVASRADKIINEELSKYEEGDL